MSTKFAMNGYFSNNKKKRYVAWHPHSTLAMLMAFDGKVDS